MPKADWERPEGERHYIRHRTRKDTCIGIYTDGVLLFIDDEPVGEMMNKVSEAIKYYDENHNN